MTTVTYTSPRTGEDVTVAGHEIDGRYPDTYLTLDTSRGVLRIPWTAVSTVESEGE